MTGELLRCAPLLPNTEENYPQSITEEQLSITSHILQSGHGHLSSFLDPAGDGMQEIDFYIFSIKIQKWINTKPNLNEDGTSSHLMRE